MTDYVKLGAILKEARESASPKITQKFVADMLHVTAANVSSWEHGKSRIDIESYIRLCHLYGINAVYPLAECSDNFTYPRLNVDVPGQPMSDGTEFSYEPKKSPSISDEEQEVLDKYNSLDAKDQGRAIGYMDRLLEDVKYQKDAVLKSS